MNVAELRAALAGLPDDYEVVVSPGDATWTEMSFDRTLPPEGGRGLVLFSEGQEVTEDQAIPLRLGYDESAEIPYQDVPDDWEILHMDQDSSTWVKATTGAGAVQPDDLVTARPSERYFREVLG